MNDRQIDELNLRAMTNQAHWAMLKKLLKKQQHGYTGWDRMDSIGAEYMIDRLEYHVSEARDDPKQWIDVVNLAAMLWWHYRSKGLT